MTSETEVRAVASEVLSLDWPRLAGARFSDYRNNWLLNQAKDVASLLIYEFGCKDPAAVVAAVMGDVNYKSAHQPAWCKVVSWLLYNLYRYRYWCTGCKGVSSSVHEPHSLPGPQHLAPLPRAGCQVRKDRRSRLARPHDSWPKRAQY